MAEMIPEVLKLLGLLLGGGVLGEIVKLALTHGSARDVDRRAINAELWERLDKTDDELEDLKKKYWNLFAENEHCKSKTAELEATIRRLERRIERQEQAQARLFGHAFGLSQGGAT